MKRDRDRPAYEGRGDAATELDSHLQMIIDDLRARGMEAEEARREAHRRFGERAEILEECRRLDRRLEHSESRRDALVDVRADLKQAVRRLSKAPIATLGIIASLGLSIGATTALFSLVRGVLLQPLPYEEPLQLALVSAENEERGWDGMPLPPGVFDEMRAEPASTFELAVYRTQQATLLSQGAPRRLQVAAVSSNLLDVLGTPPALGQGFASTDPGHQNRPCLLGNGLWRRDFGASRSVVGEVLKLEGDLPSCEVIGVLPGGFDFPDRDTELLTLYSAESGESPWSNWYLRGLIRLAPDTGLHSAQLELDQRAEAWSDHLPFDGSWRFVAESLHESRVGEVKSALWMLLGAVSMVLLIACANLGGLLMARTAERHGELSLRRALGASRWRIARQLLAENLLLCGLGGLLGVAVATLGLKAFKTRPPVDLPRLDEVTLDGWLLAGALLATGASVLLSWLPPLSHALRDANPGSSSRTSGSPSRSRVRTALVVLEAALAVALLVGAGLLTRSFVTLTAVDPGFDTVSTAALKIELPPSRYPDQASRRSFFEELLRRVDAVPGVARAGVTTGLPLSGVSMISRLHIEGDERLQETQPQVAIDAVSPEYFETLGVPLLDGRFFDGRDHESAPRVAVINAEIAKEYFLEGRAVGSTILFDEDGPALRVVGVVAAVKQYGLAKETPLEYFLPFAQRPRGTAHLVVGLNVPAEIVGDEIRAVVASLDPALPVSGVEPLEEALSSSVARERFYALAMMSFAALAALLAALGLYGIMAFAVDRRRQELSVRMALGAERRTVFVSVVRRGMALGVLGVGLGLALSFLLSQALDGLLFGITSVDPPTFLTSSLLVLAIAALASCLPALRATRSELTEILRSE